MTTSDYFIHFVSSQSSYLDGMKMGDTQENPSDHLQVEFISYLTGAVLNSTVVKD